MATHPQPIDLAGAIADLTPIDWASLEAEAPGPVDRAAIRRLKLLDRIVRACADISSARGEALSIGESVAAQRTSVDDAPPTTWGPFTIHERVGRGTFGNVYRAHDRRLDRIVALKLLRPGRDDGDVVAAEAIQEGRLLAKVRHPNVVTVYGAERIDGRVGIWMEFIVGRTLEEELKANGPLPVQDIIALGLSLCEALTAVHEAGLLHRDLKASNVLRASDGRILLTDFGTGHVIAAHDEEGSPELAGTPLYLAPEVLAGKPASILSEIYGFGVLLYHIATGSFPVRGRTLRELRGAHARGERVSIRAYRDTLSRSLMAVIERAIDPDPTKRLTSVEGLRAALRRAGRRAISWPLVAACAAACALAMVTLVRMRQPALAVVAQHVVARTSQSPAIDIEFVRGNRVYFTESGSLYRTGLGLADKPEPIIDKWDGFLVIDTDSTESEYLALGAGEPNGDRQLWIVTPASGHMRTVGSVKCGSAAWSPDNSQIACLVAGNALSITKSDGSTVRPLHIPLSLDETIFRPHWSPDGTRLRFTAATHNRDVGTSAIWEIRADGSGLHEVLPGWNAPLGYCCGSWTPDGDYYIFAAESRETGWMEIWARRERRTWLDWSRPAPIRLAGGSLTYDLPIFVSGDGNTIMAVGRKRQGALVRLDMQSRQFTPYLDGVVGTWIAFSPDKQAFSYISYPIKRLWQVNRTGSRQLIDAPVEVDGVMWSPDGKWLSFVSRLKGMYRRIFLANSDGSNPQPIIATDDEQGIASWSYDSSQIAYGDVPIRFGVATGTERLHIYDMNERTITDVPGSQGLWTSRYSPDGRYLAALTIDQRMMLVLRDLKTGTWLAIREANHINNLTWSHDSKFIYYDTFRTDNEPKLIRRVRISDGHVEDLANLQNYPVVPVWSGLAPDDSPLVLRNTATIDIYAMTLRRRWP